MGAVSVVEFHQLGHELGALEEVLEYRLVPALETPDIQQQCTE